MTRSEFIAGLRKGLVGLPAQAAADIVADYEAHFAEGEAAGRTEAEIAAALGDPARLAREVRAEGALSRWKQERSPAAAAAAVAAVLGLGALDILVLLPILMPVVGVLFALAIAALAGLFAGGGIFLLGPFAGFPGGALVALLAGIGVMAGATSLGALLTLASIGLVNALVWYGRLHYRLLKPVLGVQSQGAAA